MGNQLREAVLQLFPQLLMTLLIQIHHSIGLTMSDVAVPAGLYTEQKMSSKVTPLWYLPIVILLTLPNTKHWALKWTQE